MHFNRIIHKSENKIKSTWKIINEEKGNSKYRPHTLFLKTNNNIISNQEVTANTFNNYFLSVAELLNNDNKGYDKKTKPIHYLGSVSVAGADEWLWAVHGGNSIVPQMLLERSQATLINARVTNVTLRPETEDFIVDSLRGEDFASSVYDIVIIATPLTEDTQSNIKFTNFPKRFIFPGVYHRTICTIVHGKLNLTHFGFKGEKDAIDEIFAISQDLIFSSVGRLSPVDYEPSEGGFDVWKVFSQKPLTKLQLNTLFLEQKDIKVTGWLAYPHYQTERRNDKFVLHKNVFHINAIEWAASAMEMSVVGAKNVGLLSYKAWTAKNKTEEVENIKVEL